jgi:cytochrome P450
MTFFGGPRSCIGYRFALAEMKAIIAILIERFQFYDIGAAVSARTFIVMRPAVEGQDGKMTNQMPLRVTRVKKP